MVFLEHFSHKGSMLIPWDHHLPLESFPTDEAPGAKTPAQLEVVPAVPYTKHHVKSPDFLLPLEIHAMVLP